MEGLKTSVKREIVLANSMFFERLTQASFSDCGAELSTECSSGRGMGHERDLAMR